MITNKEYLKIILDSYWFADLPLCQQNEIIMTKLKVQNLDEVYSSLKSLVGELKVTGWDAAFEGVYFNESDSLLGWFMKNISSLKTGVKDLLVAEAFGYGNYSLYEDRLFISTEATSLGLLVVVKVKWFNDNGHHDRSGRYATGSGERKEVFLLECEEK